MTAAWPPHKPSPLNVSECVVGCRWHTGIRVDRAKAPLCSSYRKMHFPIPGSPRHSRIRAAGEDAPVKTDAGWTKRVNRGKTASPQPYQHPNSVQRDDGTTLWGLERLQADLYRSLGRVSTHPSTLPAVLL